MSNVKFMNPFVEAASEVLQAEIQATVKRGTLSLQKSALTSNDITVLITLVGQVQGVVLYSMAMETGLGFVSRITEQQFTEFDNLAQSGVAEMGNVITGRATVKLSEAGFNSMISPPTLIQGQGITISTLDFSRILVPLITDFGDITVHLALRESPPGLQNQNFVPITVP
ncbi:MAG: chemotaxis protein CheX [Anaerolineaceae bacterium]|nr:chemotaxis protein CheX [Anaerolineaceae bacterium]